MMHHLDRDQLYFDRVHAVSPMIHKRRYFAWAGRENPAPSPAQKCLRSAMHAMAAAMSAQYRGVGDVLYGETRRMLEMHSQGLAQSPESQWHISYMLNQKSNRGAMGANRGTRVIPLQEIQAWLLLALYESLRVDENQSMLTAGRAFRLIQMARLYDVDDPDEISVRASQMDTSTLEDDSFGEIEEKRRTFWFAFSLDRFLCWQSEWPPTLQEDMVCTRLPAPESNFQNSQPITVDFLSEVMTEEGSSPLSPFAECVVLAALHGRCMAHRRTSAKDGAKEHRAFWVRHEWLASAVESRIKRLAESTPTSGQGLGFEGDPLLFFTKLLGQSLVLYLNCTAKRTRWNSVDHQVLSSNFEQRAFSAASEMVRLVKSAPLTCFKAHPFLPNPLAAGIAFMLHKGSADGLAKGGGDDSPESLLVMLRSLAEINGVARELLSIGTSLLCDQK